MGPVSAQLLYPEVMEPIQSFQEKIPVPELVFPAKLYVLKKKLKNDFIENPAVRYAIDNLEKEKYQDRELNDALKVLLKYAKNDTLKDMVAYLRNYIRATAQKEDALQVAQQRIATDSLRSLTDGRNYGAEDYNAYYTSDLKTLVSYIQNDSNYSWLKKISRDSVSLEVMNAADQSIDFWIKNGRREFHRFWAINKGGDSIGIWIQASPTHNRIRIYVDDDVYQTGVDRGKVREEVINNKLTDNYFNIHDVDKGDLHLFYWSDYTEIEAAFGQGYQSNWASGGENSMSLLTNIRYFINYNKNKTSWENFIHYRLGFLRSGSEDIRKNEDRLELNSKLGQKAFKHWFYTAQLNIQTILFNSYDYPSETEKKLVGNFMSPGYFSLSIGIDYKPNKNFSLYLSPIAGKWTWVRDTNGIDPTRYGVDAGKKSKGDAGARVELRNTFPLFKIMDIRNELVMFSSYYNSQQSFTADWKVQIDFKINYFMRASVYANAVYDENYSKKMQFKETLNLGVNFRF